jgi:hypothetical protein
MVLFAAGHTFGFRQSDPAWGVDAVRASMQSVHFNVQGFNRTYWDFFVGFGLVSTVFLLFTAVLAWQLGGLPQETLAAMRGTVLALVLAFVAFTVICWRFVFLVPLVFSLLITASLLAAAWLSARANR